MTGNPIDIVVIGAGTGGYVAALRAAQLGRRVALIEEDAVGGTCMNRGCIPAKHLLHQTLFLREIRSSGTLSGPAERIGLEWSKVQAEKAKVVERLVRGVEFLLQKNGVLLVRGRAALREDRRVVVRRADGETLFEAGRVVLAAGGRPADLPFLQADGVSVLTSTEALALDPPPASLLVVGAGAIGLEMGSIFSRLGTEVTVLEILPAVLPGSDRESAARLERALKAQGLKIRTRMRIEACRREAGLLELAGTDLGAGAPFSVRAEKILLAAGRRANSDRLFDGPPLLRAGRGGAIEVNARLETGLPGVYAVGDLVGGKLLAHKASHEGVAAAENAAGGDRTVDEAALPMAVFTEPEFASVGLTVEEARERGGEVRTGTFSFQANGRALTLGRADGQVKLVAGPGDRLLGAHIVGPSASEILAELTLALRSGLRIGDLIEAVHIHPTLTEAVHEAALKVHGRALHALNAPAGR